MKLLALDTSTRSATVALTIGDEIAAERQREVTTHSEGLLALIDDVLRDGGVPVGDLDGIVCGSGPGSFTGLRIGMATAKGLCFATGKRLYCVESMTALALGARDLAPLTLTVLDAGRAEVYAAVFVDGQLLGEHWVGPPDAAVESLFVPLAQGRPAVVVGEGALRYRDQLVAPDGAIDLGPPETHVLRAAHLAFAATPRVKAQHADDLEQAVPMYLRPPDIRLPAASPQHIAG